MNQFWKLLLAGGVLVAVLIAALRFGGPGAVDDTRKLIVYCAAGARVAAEDTARQYEKEYGVKVEFQFGGSNTLLNQIEVDKFGAPDLFLAADELYVAKAQQKGLAAEVLPLAELRPVVAVRNDCPKKIETLTDLLSSDVALALADPDQAAVGLAVRQRLQKLAVGASNRWEQLRQHVTTSRGVFKPTVTDVASDVIIGSVDAGIVWDATVAMPKYREQLRAIRLPELDGPPSLMSVCVLNASQRPTAALKFARYLTARDRGLVHFGQHGFTPVEGDVWAERPEITFFCGAVNRRSVEGVLSEFQEREDCVVNTSYDGCGILTGKMKAITGQDPASGFPDVYMACDVYYLDNVKEWFQEAVNISDAAIVIAVPKGSTKVRTLEDLVKPSIRVAVGEPDKCTIGALTRRMLQAERLYDRLKEKQRQPGEVVVEKSSSAQLVPDVLTNSVDAAVAYITDVRANLDRVDVVHIESSQNLAVQPFSIAKTSRHKYLGRRLFQKLAHSPAAFTHAGFRFLLEETDSRTPPERDGGGAEPPARTGEAKRP